MEVDRRAFLATLGAGALELMSPEDKAEALEHYMEHELDEAIAVRDGTEKMLYMPDGEAIALSELQQEDPRPPRGTGSLFMPRTGGATTRFRYPPETARRDPTGRSYRRSRAREAARCTASRTTNS